MLTGCLCAWIEDWVSDDAIDPLQQQFALRYGLDMDAVRNWEHGRLDPDRAARNFWAVIEREPERVLEALAVPVP